jgi:hypothetical protein
VRSADGIERYYVLHPVMACDVYGTGPLIKEPAYRFQAVFSKDRFRIFRTYLETGRQDDTSGPISDRFEDIEIEEHLQEMSLLGSSEILSVAREHGRMFGQATFDQLTVPNRETVTIEFPVRHINTDSDHGAYQVETGTVALPNRSSTGNSGIDRLSICYIAFNSLTEMSILSLPVSKVTKQDCTILLYGYTTIPAPPTA